MSIKILLVNDEPITILGLKKMLEPEKEIRILDVLSRSDKVLETIENDRPDVLITGIHVNGEDGIDMTQLVKKVYPDVGVVLLSNYRNNDFYYSVALDVGASVFVTKKESISEFIKAIKQTYLGYTLIFDHQKRQSKQRLTKTERNVLLLIAEDKTNFEISMELKISKRTIEHHISSIINKLDVCSRLGAVMKGIREGIISI